jgi:hypothetical protein
MGVIDVPMLALIARFVVEDIDEVFLQQQVDEIKRHVGDAEGDELHRLALQWIREHVEHYRREWQKRNCPGSSSTSAARTARWCTAARTNPFAPSTTTGIPS